MSMLLEVIREMCMSQQQEEKQSLLESKVVTQLEKSIEVMTWLVLDKVLTLL